MLEEITVKHSQEHIEEYRLKNLFTSCINLSKVNLKGSIFSAER